MKRILALVLLACPFLGMPANAQSWAGEESRSARQDDAIIPLASVIKKLLKEQGGRYLDGELKKKSNGRSEYHITWEKNGRKIEFVVDARNGRIIRRSGG